MKRLAAACFLALAVTVLGLVAVSTGSATAEGSTAKPAPARAPSMREAATTQASSPSGAIVPGFDTTSYGGNDDGSYPCVGQGAGTPGGCDPSTVTLPFPIDFFGTTYNNLYLNNNGNLTFGTYLSTYTPYPLSETGPPMIAPFFADVDTRTGNTVGFGSGTVDGHNAWGVTWPGVGCYSEITSVLDTFQVILVDRSDIAAGDFDVEFNYGNVQWDSGQASGGDANCVGGTAARVGYTSGSAETGTYFEAPGSGDNDALLDSNSATGLINNSYNSNQLGRYVYKFRNGQPLTTTGAPPDTTGQGDGSSTGHDPTCSTSQPVNCASGEFWHSFTDFTLAGRGPALNLTRVYNSMSAGTAGMFGHGWASTYDMRLVDNGGGTVTITAEDGSQVTAAASGGGTYSFPTWANSTLTHNGDGTWTFVRRQTQTFTFSAAGRLTSIADLNGYTTALSYDANGNLATVTDPSGRKLTYTYGSDGFVSSVGDPVHTTHYAYDAAGDLTSVTDAAGHVTSFTYDSDHLLLTMTDPNGGTLTNSYDASGRVVAQTDPLGRATTFAYTGNNYSASGGTTTIADPNGNVEVQHYENGELMSLTRADGTAAEATWTYTYDTNTLGRTSVTDPNGHTTQSTFDAAGNLTSFTDALGRTTTSTFNDFDEPLSVTDPSGVVTTYAYDAHGNLLSISRPAGAQTQTESFSYADSSHPGDVTSATSANGKVSHFTYDDYGNLSSSTDPAGDKTTYVHDVLSQLLSYVSPRGNASGADPLQFTTTYTYDALGRLLQTVDPLGHASTHAYDADGNLTSVTDPNGNTTSYAYDRDNELTSVARGDGTTLTYAYDADGNQTSQTNGAGKTTTYAYDPLDRIASTTDPLGRTTQFAHDGVGNRTSLTDAAGRTTSFAYDAANELTSVAYSDGTTPNVAFTYTANGLRASMTDGTGTTSYSYDTLNRLTSQTNGAGQSVSYGYDLNGNLTSITYPNGKTVTRTYDDANRLRSITDWLSHTTTFSEDANNNVTGVAYANAVTATTAFDATNQVTSVSDKNGSGSTLASFSYTRDANGQVTGTTPTGTGQGGAETYAYTKLNQVSSVNGSSYTRDAAENLTALANGTTLQYDAANEATKVTPPGAQPTPMSYDAQGNRLNGLGADGTAAAYAYDQANRLVSSSGSGGHLLAYAAATACDAITVTHGGDDFSNGTLWSNGGIKASGTSNAASVVRVAKAPPTCSFPSQFTPPGPTQVPARAPGDWPVTPPAPPSSCTSGNAPTINAAWLGSHAPGVYCWTGTISISAAGATFNGYEFVSKGSTQAGAITVLQASTFVGSDSNGKIVLYATAGGISFNQAVTLKGQAMAPQGRVLFGGAGTNVQGGFVEANTIVFNNGPSTFVGSGPDPASATYTYDGDGLRATATSGGTTQHFAWNDASRVPLMLTDGSTSYVYDDSGIPVEQIDATGKVLYYQHDQLGSTRLLTDASGAVAATFAYDPYGKLTAHGGSADTPLRWNGQYQDPTGLYYLRVRYYDPQTAQFISRDPVAPLTQDPYGYAGGNPLNWADPLGLGCGWLSPWDCIWDGLKWLYNEVVDNAEQISAVTSNLALAAAVVGCEPCAAVLGGISLVTGAIATGQEIENGDYVWASIDAATAVLGEAGDLAKLMDEAATITWDANRLAWAARAAHSRDLLEQAKFKLQVLSTVLTDIEETIKQLQEEKDSDPCPQGST